MAFQVKPEDKKRKGRQSKSFNLPDQDLRVLNMLAAARNMNNSAIVRDAVREYLRKDDVQAELAEAFNLAMVS